MVLKDEYNHNVRISLFLLYIFLMLTKSAYADGVKEIDPSKPLQAQFSHDKVVYLIRKDCDLKGQKLELPKEVILRFEGGMIKNGILSNSIFYVDAPRTQIFENVFFTTNVDDGLKQVDPVRVEILKDDSFYNIETDAIVKRGDIVCKRSLYKISSPSKTTNSTNKTRRVVVLGKEYIVNDKYGNYTYPVRSIVGINSSTGKLLHSSVVDKREEFFYKISPLLYKDVSRLRNREIYPEWFGCYPDTGVDQSLFINYCIEVGTNSKSILSFTSGEYVISSPLIATTNTKIVGVESSPWDGCTKFLAKTKTCFIVFDEKGCSNVRIEGLSFYPYTQKWIESYTGIEVRTSIRGITLKDISCFQPNIGIHLYAYADLTSTCIDNYIQLAGVYGIVMQPIFKTTFHCSYCNGNLINVKTGGSQNLKRNAIYMKNCEGNAISFNAGEQYGNPSVFCDNSIVTITGISWHEESIFLQAINHSRIYIDGEIYARGGYLLDETSTMNNSNIMEHRFRHATINPNYHVADMKTIKKISFDPYHKALLNWDGNVITEISPMNIRYVNGNPYYLQKLKSIISIPYNKENGVTIFLRVSSSGNCINSIPELSINGYSVIQLSSSLLFPIACIKSTQKGNTIGYLGKGESILSLCIKDGIVSRTDGQLVGLISEDGDSLLLQLDSGSEMSLMFSDILIVDGVDKSEETNQEYERYLVESPLVEIPKAGVNRPILSEAYQGHLFYDKTIDSLLIWTGSEWKIITGSIAN